MKVLIACEFSGTVREAFSALGHDAWSCDLLPTEKPGNHIEGDVLDVLREPWDMVIAHPPCTYLTVSGNKWMKPEFSSKFPDRHKQRAEGIRFFLSCYQANAPRVAVENPVGIMSTAFRKPDQVIHPWQFGHGETKATCLWLRGLPKLAPTHLSGDMFAEAEPVDREQRLHKLPPGPDRWKERSRTYPGIAAAMAEQWGNTASMVAA